MRAQLALALLVGLQAFVPNANAAKEIASTHNKTTNYEGPQSATSAIAGVASVLISTPLPMAPEIRSAKAASAAAFPGHGQAVKGISAGEQ